MLWFKEERNWETPYGYLYQVWVWDEFQGQGLGRELMKALETELLSRGLKRLRLHVFAFNERAVKLYESMGFETTNLVMVKELK
jgi:ribosomal protein S18 acetylase RimI-like enzyme